MHQITLEIDDSMLKTLQSLAEKYGISPEEAAVGLLKLGALQAALAKMSTEDARNPFRGLGSSGSC